MKKLLVALFLLLVSLPASGVANPSPCPNSKVVKDPKIATWMDRNCKIHSRKDLDAILELHLVWIKKYRNDIRKLKEDVSFPIPELSDEARMDPRRANLAGANLSGISFAGANLTGADLSGAVLARAGFSGADLSGAVLTGAHLTGANLRSVPLVRANLEGADLTGADLNGAHLIGASLLEADLAGANNLSKADLTGASFFGADLTGVDLTGADATGASFFGADLTGVILIDAHLNGAILTSVPLVHAVLIGADLTGASLDQADLTGADLTKADLSGAILSKANLSGATLSKACLGLALLDQADLTGAILTKADLWKTSITHANLSNADLTQTTFGETIFEPAVLPPMNTIARADGLRTLGWSKNLSTADDTPENRLRLQNQYAVLDVVKALHVAGYHWAEAEANLAYHRHMQSWWQMVLFDWTCEWGANWQRPIWIVTWLAVIFVVVYWLVLRFSRLSRLRCGDLDRDLDRLRPRCRRRPSQLLVVARMRGEEREWPVGRDFAPLPWFYLPRPRERYWYLRLPVTLFWSVVARLRWEQPLFWTASMFSMMSVLNLGVQGLDLGRWLRLMQRREFDLRARGTIRLLAGFQSVASFLLLAMTAYIVLVQPLGE